MLSDLSRYAGITLMPDSWAYWTVYIIFFVALIILAIIESLHIAAVQLNRQDPKLYIDTHPRAARVIEYQNSGRNFQCFLIGRQVIVVFCIFVLGRCTTFESFFEPIPKWFDEWVMFSGVLGVLVVVQIGQLTPQILSSNVPVSYLNMPLMNWIYYFCVWIEKTGICYTVWLMSSCLQKLNRQNCCGSSKRNRIQCIDQHSTFEHVINCDYNIKAKMCQFIWDLRSELHIDEKSKLNVSMDFDEDAIDEYTPLNSQRTMPLENVKYLFPSARECAKKFEEAGLDTPDFLRDVNHRDYIPPHLVLMYVLQKHVLRDSPGTGRYTMTL